MEKFMSKRIDTEGRIKKKFKEQDRHFLGLGCDNIKLDRTVRKVMSDLSGLKKLVKGLSDRFDEYERRKVFDAKRVLEKELVNEKNAKEFYREFSEYMCRMLQNCQKSEDFMKCSPITFRGNEGAVGLIRWIDKTEMVFTVSKCTEANKVVFAAATFQDRALTWWNSQVATLGIEVVPRKTWADMKVMMTEEFCPLEEIQRMEERKKVEAYIRGLSENIKGEVTSSEPATLNKAIGHKARDCWSKVVATGANGQPVVTCYGCGEKGHIKTNCPTRNNPGRGGARGQAYALRDGDQNLGPNVVT
nr:hypothetical protein [Tanacetum cinerariifolium]